MPHPIRWIYGILKERPKLLTFMIFGIIVHQSLRFFIPVIIGDLVEFGIQPKNASTIKYFSWLLLVVALSSAFFDMTMSWANEIAANDIERKSRSRFFASILRKTMTFHDEARMGELMSIAQNDLQALYRTIAPGIRLFGESIVSVTVVIILIFNESVILGTVFLILLPPWLYVLNHHNHRLRPAAIAQQDLFRDVASVVQENLNASRIVRAYAQEEYETSSFRSVNDQYTQAWEHRGWVSASYFPMLFTYILSGLMFILAALLYIYTPQIQIFGYQVQAHITIGGMITVMGLMIQFRSPTYFVGSTLDFASLGFAGVQKLQAVVANEQVEEDTGEVDEVPYGNIVFDHVSYGINGSVILDDVSLEVESGEVIAIVGPPGSGKTTLMKLLTRFYEPTSGKITLGGTDLRSIKLNSLRNNIGVVEQDVHLFSASIKENITFGVDQDEIDMDKLIDVAKKARIHDFVMTLDDKYDTQVGVRGSRLSGGQKQRVAMARAFLANPSILIMDDSTSAIDGKTESEIVAAIQELMVARTTFLITNRLNMMRNADRIMVLDNGQVTAIGSHQQLLQENAIYQRIFEPYKVKNL